MNNESQLIDVLHNLVNVSESLLDLAKNQLWEEFVPLAEQRQLIIDLHRVELQNVTQDKGVEVNCKFSELIETNRRLNTELLNLSSQHKGKLGKALAGFHRGARAQAIYRQSLDR